MNQSTKTIRLTEDEVRILNKLQDEFGAINLRDAFRKTLAQAATLSKERDKDGNLTYIGKDGEKYRIPSGW